ncbi:MAG: nucleoside monophosphate kinase [Acidobacteria bacterium]|nr:nucleoside monophosphate kinase [Acidobacteriota bacterium]
MASPQAPRRRNLVLLGPPGVGKGTQGELISSRLGPCHLSTGDLFRVARSLDPERRTPAMNEALDTIARGQLASDETVLGLVRERAACLRCDGGFLLDGFPRTAAQAAALAALLESDGLALDAAVAFSLPVDLIVARLAGRRVCGGCKRVYHVEAKPPVVAGVCDACGGHLEKRDDDQPHVVRVRMQEYEATSPPLIRYYEQRGLLLPVDAAGTPDQVFDRLSARLAASTAS